MAWYDELNQGAFQAGPRPGSIDELRAELAAKQKQQPKNKGNFLTSLIPSGGGIAGAVGGAALGTTILPGAGTIVGALLGGALGGGAGKVAENAVIGEEDLGKGVAQEALLSGVLGAGPLRLGKLGVDTVRGLKTIGTADKVLETVQTAKGIPIKSISSTSIGKAGVKIPEGAREVPIGDFNDVSFVMRFKPNATEAIKQMPSITKTFSQTGIKDPLDLLVTHLATNATKGEIRTIVNKFFPIGLDSQTKNSVIRTLQSSKDQSEIKGLLQGIDSRIKSQEGNVRGDIGINFGSGTQKQSILPAKEQPLVTREVNGKSISLSDVLIDAGNKAATGSITGAIGGKLTNASNDLVVKNFRLTPSQLNNYRAKFGEDASQTIKKYKLVGKDADTIGENAIKPLQGEFDTISKQIPTLPTADVLKAFKTKYQPLVNSAVEDKQVIGQQLKQQADTLAKKYGAEIPSSELAALRQEFDSLVNYTAQAANPARYGVNKLSADAIRTSLQQTADKAGLKASNGMTFKEVGKELSKLRELTGNIAKQEQLGRGSLPVGLGNLPGAVVGSAGGVPGALVGAVGGNIVNSPTGRRAIAGGAEKLGAKLTESAAKNKPFGVGSVAGRIAPVGVASALAQPSLENSAMAANTTTTPTNIPSNSSIDALYNTGEQMSTPESQNPYPQANLMYDLQRDPANADKYIAYFKALQEAFPESTKSSLTSTQATRAAAAQNALQDIPLIEEAIQSGKLGGAKALPGADTGIGRRLLGTENLDAALFNIADNILRARSGAAAPEAEVKRFVNTFLPGPLDSEEAKRAKLARAVRELQGFVNPQEASAGTLEEALMAQQQGGF